MKAIAALLVMMSAAFCCNAQQPIDCGSIEVEALIKPESASKASIQLLFEKGKEPRDYVIILTGLDYPGKIAKNGVTEFHDLKPGYYDIYIVDTKGCSKQLNVKVNLDPDANID